MRTQILNWRGAGEYGRGAFLYVVEYGTSRSWRALSRLRARADRDISRTMLPGGQKLATKKASADKRPLPGSGPGHSRFRLATSVTHLSVIRKAVVALVTTARSLFRVSAYHHVSQPPPPVPRSGFARSLGIFFARCLYPPAAFCRRKLRSPRGTERLRNSYNSRADSGLDVADTPRLSPSVFLTVDSTFTRVPLTAQLF